MNNNQFSVINFMDNLKQIGESILVKNNKQAEDAETVESLKDYQKYRSCIQKIDSVATYIDTIDGLLAIGNTVTNGTSTPYFNERLKVNKDINYIAGKYTNKIIDHSRRTTKMTFVENNEYYKTYIGKPNSKLELIPKLKNLKEIHSSISSSKLNTYLHELDDDTLATLYNKNMLKFDNIYFKDRHGKDMPLDKKDYRYIDYMGPKSMNLFFIREAKNYQLLNVHCKSEWVLNTFKKAYHNNRQMLLQTVFNDYQYNNFPIYSSLFGYIIYSAAIMETITEIMKNGISRDFVDLDNYDVLLDGFGLQNMYPLPISYKKTLVKNLNYIVTNRGSSKILIDICKLFGFDDIEFFKTYLVKTHNIDSDGEPVFEYKKDQHGNKTYDYDVMYDLKFVDIPLDCDDVTGELNKSENISNYDDITMKDNFWGGGEISKEDLKQEILKMNFNQTLTKYISLKNMINISHITTEVCYFFSMVLNLKPNMEELQIQFPDLQDESIKLFDIVIYLFALTCRKYNYTGEIMYDFENNLDLEGFNFNADINSIKEIMSELDLDIDLDTFNVRDLFRDGRYLSKIFLNNKKAMDIIKNKMIRCDNIYEYKKLELIYKSLFTTNMRNDIFKIKKKDLNDNINYDMGMSEIFNKKLRKHGLIDNNEDEYIMASTYEELLKHINQSLYEKLLSIEDKNEYTNQMNYILYILDENLNSDKLYSFLFRNIDSSTIDMLKGLLFIIIDFFKSHTMQLRDFSTIYVIDDKFKNMIKVIDHLDMSNSFTKGDFIILANMLSSKIESNMLSEIDIKVLYNHLLEFSVSEKNLIKETLEKYYNFNFSSHDILATYTSIDIVRDLKEKLDIKVLYNHIIAMIKDENISLKDKLLFTVHHTIKYIMKIFIEYIIDIEFDINEEIEYNEKVFVGRSDTKMEELQKSKIIDRILPDVSFGIMTHIISMISLKFDNNMTIDDLNILLYDYAVISLDKHCNNHLRIRDEIQITYQEEK